MKRFSYAERDYDFGQAMLTLRTTIGLTQAGLADLLGVSRRAVGEWEAGISYPKAEHLKALLTLAVQQGPFQPVAKPRRSVPSGNLRPGFEAYGHLLRQVAQTGHQSYLLLTSREKPAALRALEGRHTLVRALRLGGLDAAAGEQLLAEHEVRGSSQE